MIIRKISISSWRAVADFERHLEPGINVLKGANEAGKSSIVEAVGWALHRDLVGGAHLKSDIAPIIPADNPKAKPLVELLLEFPSCTATIRKILAEDSGARECVLTIKRKGVADECFDQGDAQNQLKKLIASDGVFPNWSTPGGASAPLEGEVLLSAQGASTAFVGREFSSASRAAANSVAVGEGGILAPTSRLEKVRAALQKRKSKELFEKLKTNAVDAAKKQTDAARARDELMDLRQERARFSEIESRIGSLRAQLETLKSELARAEPAAIQNERELKILRARYTTQIKADSDVAEKRRAHEAAKSARDDWQRRVEEIVRWQSELARAERELKAAQSELQKSQESLSDLQAKYDAAWQEHHEGELQIEAAVKQFAAWNTAHEVCVAHRERSRARKRVEQLESAQNELAAREEELKQVGKAPHPSQIYQWREQFSSLQNLRQRSAHSLQLALRLQRGLSVQWQADGGEVETGDALANEEFVLGAGQSISVIIPGVGCIDVVGEGSHAQKQIAEFEAKARNLENQLKPFGVNWDALPNAFDELAKLSREEETATQKLQLAQGQWRSVLAAGEDLEEARAACEEWDAVWKNARENFDAVREMLPDGIKEMTALRERDRWRENENNLRNQNARAQKNWQGAFAALNAAKNNASQAQSKIGGMEEIQNRATTRLAALQSDDGESDESRAQVLDELNTALYESKIARDTAITKRESLGAAVTDETLGHAAHETEYSRQELHRLQTELAERRMELRGHCEQDPQTEIEKFDFQIEERETEITRHEARLRGLGVLDAALEAERHRLGRELATPLNKFLSPWLSELRGKETHLEFDENGGRIIGIRSGLNGSTHSLPFGSHSGGMQEQTALVLRLILARLAAQKLPSGRLPIILDDPLTQTDTTRREGLWRVLREASANLQIVFVTCHHVQVPHGDAHHIALGEWREEEVVEARKDVKKAPRKSAKKEDKVQEEKPKASAIETPSLW